MLFNRHLGDDASGSWSNHCYQELYGVIDASSSLCVSDCTGAVPRKEPVFTPADATRILVIATGSWAAAYDGLPAGFDLDAEALDRWARDHGSVGALLDLFGRVLVMGSITRDDVAEFVRRVPGDYRLGSEPLDIEALYRDAVGSGKNMRFLQEWLRRTISSYRQRRRSEDERRGSAR